MFLGASENYRKKLNILAVVLTILTHNRQINFQGPMITSIHAWEVFRSRKLFVQGKPFQVVYTK